MVGIRFRDSEKEKTYLYYLLTSQYFPDNSLFSLSASTGSVSSIFLDFISSSISFFFVCFKISFPLVTHHEYHCGEFEA